MSTEALLRQYFEPDAELPQAARQRLLEMLTPVDIPKGGIFLQPGSTADRLAFVKKGCLRYYYLKDGEEVTGEFWQESDLVGSYETSIQQKPSSQCIDVIEDASLLCFSYASLKGIAGEFPALNTSIIAILERFIVESQQRIAAYILERPEERYLRLREEMPGIENRVHQKYIASFVGVTPVTLSRIRARLAGRQ